ncbi:hypothetical protein G6M26_33760 [Agrobacterium tumefaciens]|nr:hypothetical protein [Agrobacterium tumefaciens]
MKIKFTIFLFLLSLGACTQDDNKTMDNNKPLITDSNKEKITAQNYLEEQVKYIKPSSNEPLYYIYVNHEQCFFEILVNDVPRFQYFEEGSIMTPINLNNYINRSGKQTITYRLYPQTTKGLNHLTEYTNIKIELYERNNADTVNGFEHQKLLLTHRSATKTDGKKFIGDGKDYYEFSFDFDAKVLYQLEGWENSKDLSKMDQKELLSKTEEAYRYYWNLIKDKRMDDYFRLRFRGYISEAISTYMSKEMIIQSAPEDKFMFNEPTFKLEPLSNYKMKLYGNGKIVCLEQSSEDLRLKNKTPIWGKYKTAQGETRVRFNKLYLHIPKGKDTFEIL